MSGSNGNGTALAASVKALRADLVTRKETIFSAAAAHIKPERFIELVARQCIQLPQLMDCSKVSLFESAAEAARLGLELGGVLGQAYLIPYKGEAQLVLGYKGYKELAYRSGRVKVIDSGTVRPGERFEYMLGTEQYVRHTPIDEAVADWTHCYAFAKTDLGENVVCVMSKARIEAHRNKFSNGWNRKGSAWLSNPEAMGEKTCIHRIARKLPLSPEFQQIVERAEYIEHGAIVSSTASILSSGEAPPTDDVEQLKRDLDGEPDEDEQERIRRREIEEAKLYA